MSNDRKLDYENRKDVICKLIERELYPKLNNYGEVPYFGLSNLGSNIYNNHNFPIIPSVILCSGLSSLWSTRTTVDDRVFENPFSNTDFLLSINKNIFSPSYRNDFAINSFLNIFKILCKLIKIYPNYFYKDKYFLDYLVDDLPYMLPLIRVYAYKDLRKSEIRNIQKHCIDKIIDFINYDDSVKDDSYVYINRFMKISFIIHNIDSLKRYCYLDNYIEDKEKILNSITQFNNELLETINQKFNDTLGSVVFYSMWGCSDIHKTVNNLLEDFQIIMFLLDSKYSQKISNASLTVSEIFILDSVINFLITEYDRTFLSILKNPKINISYTKDSLNDDYKKHFLNLKKLISMRNKIITGHISKKYIQIISTDELNDHLVFIKHDIRLEEHRNLCTMNNFRDNPELCNVIEKHCNNFINYIKITQPIYFQTF